MKSLNLKNPFFKFYQRNLKKDLIHFSNNSLVHLTKLCKYSFHSNAKKKYIYHIFKKSFLGGKNQNAKDYYSKLLIRKL